MKQNIELISVIIPTYKDWDRLQLCIDALLNQSYSRGKYEIIVVNNAPNDPVPSTFKNKNKISIINQSIPGSYAARNKGIEMAKGTIFAFTDSDCIPNKYWLEHGLNAFDARVGMIAGKVEFFFKGIIPNVYEYVDSATKLNQEHYVNLGFGATANLFVKREVFDMCGNFDPELKSGGDYEFGIRASKIGFNIKYSPESIVLHPARSTSSEILKKSKRVIGGQRDLKNKKVINVNQIRAYLPVVKVPANRHYNSNKIYYKIKILIFMNFKKLYTNIYKFKMVFSNVNYNNK